MSNPFGKNKPVSEQHEVTTPVKTIPLAHEWKTTQTDLPRNLFPHPIVTECWNPSALQSQFGEAVTWLRTYLAGGNGPRILVLCGPSGCGKTHLIRYLTYCFGLEYEEWIPPLDWSDAKKEKTSSVSTPKKSASQKSILQFVKTDSTSRTHYPSWFRSLLNTWKDEYGKTSVLVWDRAHLLPKKSSRRIWKSFVQYGLKASKQFLGKLKPFIILCDQSYPLNQFLHQYAKWIYVNPPSDGIIETCIRLWFPSLQINQEVRDSIHDAAGNWNQACFEVYWNHVLKTKTIETVSCGVCEHSFQSSASGTRQHSCSSWICPRCSLKTTTTKLTCVQCKSILTPQSLTDPLDDYLRVLKDSPFNAAQRIYNRRKLIGKLHLDELANVFKSGDVFLQDLIDENHHWMYQENKEKSMNDSTTHSLEDWSGRMDRFADMDMIETFWGTEPEITRDYRYEYITEPILNGVVTLPSKLYFTRKKSDRYPYVLRPSTHSLSTHCYTNKQELNQAYHRWLGGAIGRDRAKEEKAQITVLKVKKSVKTDKKVPQALHLPSSKKVQKRPLEYGDWFFTFRDWIQEISYPFKDAVSYKDVEYVPEEDTQERPTKRLKMDTYKCENEACTIRTSCPGSYCRNCWIIYEVFHGIKMPRLNTTYNLTQVIQDG